MKISFDAQPLLDGQKTGVGFNEANTINYLKTRYPDNSYNIECFRYGSKKENYERLKPFKSENCTINVNKIPGWLYRILWNFIPVPYKWFFKTKSDITHFFNYHIPPGVHGKTIVNVHDMGFRVYPETIRLKTKIMLFLSLKKSCVRAEKIITVSEFSKKEINKYLKINKDKIIVAPNGVDHNIFKPCTDVQKIERLKKRHNINGEYFMFLGTLEPRKNIERIIKAYAVLKQILKDVPKLVLAGRKGWMYKNIFKMIKKLDLIDNVVFTGYLDDIDTPVLMSGATAFLFPSLYEGFGMPVLEAMACGTPVITSNCSSLPEVAGDAAILVDPYSTDEIIKGMKNLIQNEELRKELSEKGIKRAALFTWENSVDIVHEVYRDLVK